MKYDWRNSLEWERQGSERMGQCGFPIDIYIAELGKDKDGRTWLVECQSLAMNGSNKFRLSFDHAEEPNEENGCTGDWPFLRNEVLDADDYVSARKRRYRMKEVLYKDIVSTIERVTDEIGIV